MLGDVNIGRGSCQRAVACSRCCNVLKVAVNSREHAVAKFAGEAGTRCIATGRVMDCGVTRMRSWTSSDVSVPKRTTATTQRVGHQRRRYWAIWPVSARSQRVMADLLQTTDFTNEAGWCALVEPYAGRRGLHGPRRLWRSGLWRHQEGGQLNKDRIQTCNVAFILKSFPGLCEVTRHIRVLASLTLGKIGSCPFRRGQHSGAADGHDLCTEETRVVPRKTTAGPRRWPIGLFLGRPLRAAEDPEVGVPSFATRVRSGGLLVRGSRLPALRPRNPEQSVPLGHVDGVTSGESAWRGNHSSFATLSRKAAALLDDRSLQEAGLFVGAHGTDGHESWVWSGLRARPARRL